jgi:hypothetical protein
MDMTVITCNIWAMLYSKYDFHPGSVMYGLLVVYKNVKSDRKREKN